MSHWQKMISYLRKNGELIILVHEKPDGDCLGSALALGLHLQAAGYRPTLFLPEPVPLTYDFLPGQELIKALEKGEQLPEAQLIVAVDCADQSRILYSFPEQASAQTPVFNIDHHCSNTLFGDCNIVDPNAAATGEMIFHLLKESGIPISPAVATCLYVAIIADTGSFTYSNTSAETFHIAAELLELGSDMNLIRHNLYDRRPVLELINIKLTLSKLQFTEDHRVVWSALSHEELASHNLLHTDTDSVLNLMRSVEGVEAAIIFRELEPGVIKISFRSQNQLDVNCIACEFGGGGHARAAGCTLNGDLSTTIARVINRTQEQLQKNPHQRR
jgi:phosphoesterase RecJ-like protein